MTEAAASPASGLGAWWRLIYNPSTLSFLHPCCYLAGNDHMDTHTRGPAGMALAVAERDASELQENTIDKSWNPARDVSQPLSLASFLSCSIRFTRFKNIAVKMPLCVPSILLPSKFYSRVTNDYIQSVNGARKSPDACIPLDYQPQQGRRWCLIQLGFFPKSKLIPFLPFPFPSSFSHTSTTISFSITTCLPLPPPSLSRLLLAGKDVNK